MSRQVTAATLSRPVPESDTELFSAAALLDPYPHYAMLRSLGPAVFLTRYGMYGLFRHDDVRPALVGWERFSSAEGIAMNPVTNELMAGSILGMDPPRQRVVRKVFDDALRPKYVRKVAGDLERLAGDLVDGLVRQREFDGVADFARKLPVDIVLDLIGFPRDGERADLLEWALGAFDFMGPASAHQSSCRPDVEALMQYLATKATPEKLLDGSFGQIVWQAVDRGEITDTEAVMTMSAYACAGVDTTIAGISSTLWLLAQHPGEWAQVRADPETVAGAFLEGLRMEAPVQSFARVTTCDVPLEDLTIPAGSRVVLSYGSAGRDERHYPDPDRFRVRRAPSDTVAFGFGVHHCPGRALATMEAHALFTALARRVDRIELAGAVRRTPNAITRGLSALPIRVT
ncbi:cytochrome P450 [Amycolatopsis jejuensis]|uniref:cytochrome P450 n=1 Tax=Amycolatopsis jejuensis TaxID=330084 RepID=UPI000690D082|nr:cytochrome P450 [Amycolatopsis jejuensis]